MTLKTLAAASCLSMAMATAALAAPVNFNFSFTDGTNTITGLIEGLDSDGLGQAASMITVNGVFDTYVFGPGDFSFNSIDVSGSMLDPDTIFVRGTISTSTVAQADFFLFPSSGGELFESLADFTRVETFNPTWTFTATPVSSVPLPAGGFLLLSGLGGVAALNRRKKRAA